MPAMFPVFLELDGRNVLVVGGGAVAESKTKSLLEAGARVTVVAPSIGFTWTDPNVIFRRNCLPLWVDQGDGGVVGSTKD